MKPEEEAEVPVEGKESAPDREAEVPQAAAAASQPSLELPAARQAASPDREGRKAKDPVDTQKKDETPGPTIPHTLPSTRTMTGICGIPHRPRRGLQPRSLVTAEEWKKASETAHIVFPNRDSEWNGATTSCTRLSMLPEPLGGLIKNTPTLETGNLRHGLCSSGT